MNVLPLVLIFLSLEIFASTSLTKPALVDPAGPVSYFLIQILRECGPTTGSIHLLPRTKTLMKYENMFKEWGVAFFGE